MVRVYSFHFDQEKIKSLKSAIGILRKDTHNLYGFWASISIFIFFALVIFFVSILGIYTRLASDLAAFWPANALLLGIFVRFPQLVTPFSWLGALAGYIAADKLFDGGWMAAGLLTVANLTGVWVGYMAVSRLGEDDRRLKRPLSVLYLVLVVIVAATAAGVVGAIANPILFGGGMLVGWGLWFITELVNYVAILPVMLTLPPLRMPVRERRKWTPASISPARLMPLAARLMPLAALILTMVIGIWVNGPGAVAFPVPALLWCALSYSLFTNTLLALLFSAWTLLAIATGHLLVGEDVGDRGMLLSIRLSVTFIALAPLVVASVMAARDELLARLSYMATHDHLTGLPNREAFRERAGRLLERLSGDRRAVAVMMLDIDRFKSVNDAHGHAAGDSLIASFARIVRDTLRREDVSGRVGGEEFAVLLPDCSEENALAVAERIRKEFAAFALDLGEAGALSRTVSIGIAFAPQAPEGLDMMMKQADQALYRAKQWGRDRVEMLRYDEGV